MRGKIGEISIVGLLKTFHDGHQSGRLRLNGPDGSADVYFQRGDLVAVAFEGLTSLDGPYDIFRWRDGEFEFDLAASSPARTFEIPVDEFLDRGADFERRWYNFGRDEINAFTIVRPLDPSREPGVDAKDRDFVNAIGDERSLIGLAQRLGIGLLDAAERAGRLRAAGLVEIQKPSALKFAAAVQDLTQALLEKYEVFAGKTLTRNLTGRAYDYALGLGLSASLASGGVRVDLTEDTPTTVATVRSLFRFILEQMAGPIGDEATELLWRKATKTLEPAARVLVELYGLNVDVREAGNREKAD